MLLGGDAREPLRPLPLQVLRPAELPPYHATCGGTPAWSRWIACDTDDALGVALRVCASERTAAFTRWTLAGLTVFFGRQRRLGRHSARGRDQVDLQAAGGGSVVVEGCVKAARGQGRSYLLADTDTKEQQ